jgi:hypothetical protein
MIIIRLLKRVRKFIKQHDKDTDIDRVSDEVLLELIKDCLTARLLEKVRENQTNLEDVIEF